MHAQRIKRGAQHILVLVESYGLEALLHSGPHGKSNHVSAAVRRVRAEAFVKNQDQNAILLEPGSIEQRRDIVLEPRVRGGQLYVIGAAGGRRGTIMRVVVLVGHDE